MWGQIGLDIMTVLFLMSTHCWGYVASTLPKSELGLPPRIIMCKSILEVTSCGLTALAATDVPRRAISVYVVVLLTFFKLHL